MYDASEVPAESLIINASPLYFRKWSELVQLEVMRHYLSEGLNVHFGANTLLHDIFEQRPNAAPDQPRMTANDKRMMRSSLNSLSKQRSLGRSKDNVPKGAEWLNDHADD